MTVLAILQYPDPRLKRVSIPVAPDNITSPEVQKAIDDMFETHYNADNCAALAATQLDMDPAWRITVIDFSEGKDSPLCLINGEIIESKGEVLEDEACMSVYPEIAREKVKRAAWIKVKYYDRQGKLNELVAEDFMAKCIQHELDHLDGKIYLDRLSILRRDRLLNRLKKEGKA